MSISNILVPNNYKIYSDNTINETSEISTNLKLDYINTQSLLQTDSSGNVSGLEFSINDNWDPNLSPDVNINAINLTNAYYRRFGNEVICFLSGSCQMISSNLGIISLTLPILRNLSFASESELIGSGSKYISSTGANFLISAYAMVGTDDQAKLLIQNNTITVDNFSVIFSYRLI